MVANCSADEVPGTITTVAGGWNGDGGPATEAVLDPGGIAFGPDGSLYIADAMNNRIRRVGPDGTITTVAGTGAEAFFGEAGPAIEAALASPRAIAIGANGSIYVADTSNDRIRHVDLEGTITTVAGTGEVGWSGDGGLATNAELWSPEGIALGRDGSLYIGGDSLVRRVDTDGVITTVAGTGEDGFSEHGLSGDGGPATEAQLGQGSAGLGFGIAVALDGSFYVADEDNDRVRRVGPDGVIATVAELDSPRGIVLGPDARVYVAGDRRIRRVGPDGAITTMAAERELEAPGDLAFGPDGNLYVAERGIRCVSRIDADGTITTVAGTGEWRFAGDGGPATEAGFEANDVAVGPDGSVYVADDKRVRRIAPDGVITTVVGTGEEGSSGDGGPATLAEVVPTEIAFGPDGDLYIADRWSDTVRRVDRSGTITTVLRAEELGSLYGFVAIAADPEGSLYVATGSSGYQDESGHPIENHHVHRVTPDGAVTRVAGSGKEGFAGDGGAATEAMLDSPDALAVASDGSLFIADLNNCRVRCVGPDGVITTIAGTGEEGSSGNGGPARESTLEPDGLALGPDGSVYIAETFNCRVRRVDPKGIITTVAGTGEAGFSGDGGPGTEARLKPEDIAVGPDGSLYIADACGRIRRVSV